MKFGITLANAVPFHTADAAAELARAAEAIGVESLWTVEHVVWPETYRSEHPYSRSGRMPGDPSAPIPDPLVWLSWVGARTSRLRLGTGILILPQRNPIVVAKALATLDDLSGGRVEAGIGVGWLKEEFDALGVPFARRGERTDEYIEVLRTVWAEDDARYRGEFIEFRGVNVNPKPIGKHIPITIGGHSPAAARRAGRSGDGFLPGRADLDELASLFRVVRETARAAGRDADSIVLSAGHPRGIFEDTERRVAELAELGVSRVLVPALRLAKPDPETALGGLAEVIAGCRDP